MTRKKSRVMIEAMERRLFCDSSELAETIISSTLPASISDQSVLKGTVDVQVTNDSGMEQKYNGYVGILIAYQQLSVPSGAYAVLGRDKALPMANDSIKVYKIPIDIPKAKLNDGVDTLFGVAVDETGAYSQSDPGPTLTVHPPIVTLSETESFPKLSDSTAEGSKTTTKDEVAITNSGSDPSTTPLTIGLYATPDGTIADGTAVTIITRKVTIEAGKTVVVPVSLAAVPKLGVGTYELVTQVTQTNGTVTTTNPASAPTITVTKPTTGVVLQDKITGDQEEYTPYPLDGAAQYLSKLTLDVSMHDTGSKVVGDFDVDLYASSTPDFSSAQDIDNVTLPLNDNHNGTRLFVVDYTLGDQVDVGDSQEAYIFLQIIDPTGGKSLASYSKVISFGGLIAG